MRYAGLRTTLNELADGRSVEPGSVVESAIHEGRRATERGIPAPPIPRVGAWRSSRGKIGIVHWVILGLCGVCPIGCQRSDRLDDVKTPAIAYVRALQELDTSTISSRTKDYENNADFERFRTLGGDQLANHRLVPPAKSTEVSEIRAIKENPYHLDLLLEMSWARRDFRDCNIRLEAEWSPEHRRWFFVPSGGECFGMMNTRWTNRLEVTKNRRRCDTNEGVIDIVDGVRGVERPCIDALMASFAVPWAYQLGGSGYGNWRVAGQCYVLCSEADPRIVRDALATTGLRQEREMPAELLRGLVAQSDMDGRTYHWASTEETSADPRFNYRATDVIYDADARELDLFVTFVSGTRRP